MTYEQSTGLWKSVDGRVLAECYAGYQKGKNNPDFQDKVGLGPLPQGWYTLTGPEHAGKGETSPHGPYVIRLVPDPENEMYDRSGFLVHGDSIAHPGTASFGCIIPLRGKVDGSAVLAGRALREALWKHGQLEVGRLQVVRGPWPVKEAAGHSGNPPSGLSSASIIG